MAVVSTNGQDWVGMAFHKKGVSHPMSEATKLFGGGTTVKYTNVVHDSVLGGGTWQTWTSETAPDSAGAGYNAATGGNVGDWTAGSYSFEIGYTV